VETRERNVLYYQLGSGQSPARDYRQGIYDRDLKAAVDARIARLRAGNFGDSKSVGKGVSESRIHYGPGYRIYYGVMGDEIILLLISDKGDQGADIEVAQSYWEDYKRRVKQEREQNDKKDKLSKRSPKRSKK